MTLIIGIKCQDGIVMAADGAATFSVLGQPTIRQDTIKLDIVQNKLVLGVSGPIGLGQRIKAQMDKLWAESKSPLGSMTEADAMQAMRIAMWDNAIGVEFKVAQQSAPVIGIPNAAASALSATLVALPLKFGPSLIQFDQSAAPEAATASLPFVSIGSGQSIADPFLAFLRRVLWRDRLPTLEDGIFTAVWTLDHAITTNPGGVAAPMQVIVLEQSSPPGGKSPPVFVPRQLDDEELEEHRQSVHEHEAALMRYHIIKPDDGESVIGFPEPA